MRQKNDIWIGEFDAMASNCQVLMHNIDQLTAFEAITIASQETHRIEKKFSRYIKSNLIWNINHAKGKPIEVDAETANLFNYANQCFHLSDGLFDITSGTLGQAWNFKNQQTPPDKNLIHSLLELVGWQKVSWSDNKICLPKNMRLDLGGIGKEYAVDRVCKMLERFPTANFLVNFGGDLCIQSSNQPHAWSVGIENLPNKTIKITHGALSTSGHTKRYFTYNNKRYSHILNPKTGWPIEGAPLSITVLSDNATQAGMLATFSQLQGYQAETFLKQQQVKYWCVN